MENKKLYWSIGEVAKKYNVNTSLIRFWEQEFDIIKPKRNKKGNRFFTAQDMQNFRVIYHLVKEKGYTLQGARDYFKRSKAAIDNAQMIEELEEVRGFLSKLRDKIDE